MWPVRFFFFSDSNREFVELQTLSLSRKREARFVQSQDILMTEHGRMHRQQPEEKKATLHTPQQSPPPPLGGTPMRIWPAWPDLPQEAPWKGTMMGVDEQEYYCGDKEGGGEHRWTARDRTGIARMEQYLNESDSMKVLRSWSIACLGQRSRKSTSGIL